MYFLIDCFWKIRCKVAVAQKAYKILYDVYEKLFDVSNLECLRIPQSPNRKS